VVALVLLQARVEVTGDPVVGGRLAMDRAGDSVVVVVSAGRGAGQGLEWTQVTQASGG
jgi:hypothetical protein